MLYKYKTGGHSLRQSDREGEREAKEMPLGRLVEAYRCPEGRAGAGGPNIQVDGADGAAIRQSALLFSLLPLYCDDGCRPTARNITRSVAVGGGLLFGLLAD